MAPNATRRFSLSTQHMLQHRPRNIMLLNKVYNNHRRYMAEMPHASPQVMDARTPMIFVQKNTSIERLESPWVEQKDPQGNIYVVVVFSFVVSSHVSASEFIVLFD